MYKLTRPGGFAPPWPEAIIHNFVGGDGANPYAALCCNSNVAIPFLYGTAVNGGASNRGTVFKIKNVPGYPIVWVYSFTGGIDGAMPYGNVVLDAAGNVYGTASAGGVTGAGTLFKLTQPPPIPPVPPLHAFCGGCADGANPMAGPNLNGGKLFGTTYNGGLPCVLPGCGTVYEFTLPAGPFVLQTAFTGPAADGSHPRGGVTTDPAFPGDWYGTTTQGGTAGSGVVYQIP